MPYITEDKKRRQEKDALRREAHLQQLGPRRKKRDRAACADAIAACREEHYSFDSIATTSERQACYEKGCIFPAVVEMFDQWGSTFLCRTHADLMKCRTSLEDRDNPLTFATDKKSGGSHLDGQSTFRRSSNPRPFGMLTDADRLKRVGQAAIAGDCPTVAARHAGVATDTAKRFLDRSGLPVNNGVLSPTSKIEDAIAAVSSGGTGHEAAIASGLCQSTVRKYARRAGYEFLSKDGHSRDAVVIAMRQLGGVAYWKEIAKLAAYSENRTRTVLAQMCREGSARLMLERTGHYLLVDNRG